MTDFMDYVLIMAGGIGSRFWPKSRLKRPKQFLSFFDGEPSLLKSTVDRILSLIPAERIIISTNSDYVGLVKEELPEIPDENIIGEPVAKNTAPCIAFAAALIHHRDPDSNMVVLPSDHYIRQNDIFLDDISVALNTLQSQEDQLITLGVIPNRPETGYGYIQYDDRNSVKLDGHIAYPVKTFAEKPDMQTAIKFLQSGDFLWNSGMFIWKTRSILKEIETHLPVLYHQVHTLMQHLEQNDGSIADDVLKTVYESSFPVSVDYGIMEKSESVIVIPSNFHWSDLGSWMSVYEIHKNRGDQDGNIINAGESLTVNSQNCFVSSDTNKLIALVGLQGIGVIETDDSMLICKLDRSQEVKEVYEKLSESRKKYL
ncbi:mannose-1-phosphate guanylyltransferase [Balneolales bacterium ANBcel1]|nr:mannose-1-phosphate guanylyltransferase [Balneolales bacterium ANBcel1]